MAAPPVQPAPAAANAFRLGFIGAGNLAESIARGVAASGVLPASAIRTAPHRRPERGAAFASIGAHLFDSNAQAGSASAYLEVTLRLLADLPRPEPPNHFAVSCFCML
jgi:pyrroline-5-carboxylate reductase